ncbi:GTPase Der, partial [Achromatium sp. WMS1]
MLPVIALVGRPNVGKSTLFNYLTHSRDALVADQPGLTRDRKYGISRLGHLPCVVVDTGGLGGATDGVAVLSEQQAALAIEEANHILFLVDAQAGCLGWDQQLAERLRRTGKPVTVVINKAENKDPNLVSIDFHQLGIGLPVPISASHGHGIQQLIDQVLANMTTSIAETATTENQNSGIITAVVGRPNVGKSTLINRLLGEDRLITFDQPGTTRDSQFISLQRDNDVYTLIDTAGVRRRGRITAVIEKFSVIKTLQAIEQSQVVLLILDAHAELADQDASLAGHILESGKALVVAVNKWDGLTTDNRDRFRSEVARKLGFLDFAAWHYISALYGSGVGHLLSSVKHAYANATCDLATPILNRILNQSTLNHPPPLIRGHRIKLRYAHQGGRNPPIIVIHGNQTATLPENYIRYLTNQFRQGLKLSGTPIKFIFKTSDNPYKDRR